MSVWEVIWPNQPKRKQNYQFRSHWIIMQFYIHALIIYLSLCFLFKKGFFVFYMTLNSIIKQTNKKKRQKKRNLHMKSAKANWHSRPQNQKIIPVRFRLTSLAMLIQVYHPRRQGRLVFEFWWESSFFSSRVILHCMRVLKGLLRRISSVCIHCTWLLLHFKWGHLESLRMSF